MPAGSEPVRPENPEVPEEHEIQKFQEEHEIRKFQRSTRSGSSRGARDPEVPGGARYPEVPGGAHDPMRDGVDGDEAMVNLPPEPSARQIAEHELTGHAVYRSWCRHCVASKGRPHAHSSREEGELLEIGIDYGFFGRDKEDVLPMLCVKCRNSSTGRMGATVVDRKGASDYASSFLTAFIKILGFKRILVRSDNERSLLSLIERVTCNLTGVELVLMTSPEGDHQANGLAEVGVREIKAQTRILRSQLEQRLGSRVDEQDPLMSWIPRHAANFVSRYRIMDDGRTPDQRRCGKTWKRPVVEFGESVHFRPVGGNNALRVGDQRLLRSVYVQAVYEYWSARPWTGWLTSLCPCSSSSSGLLSFSSCL